MNISSNAGEKRPREATAEVVSCCKLAHLEVSSQVDTIVSAASEQTPFTSPVATSSDINTTNPFTGRPYSAGYRRLLEARKQLPVYMKKELIQKTVLENRVTLLVGETGSGKTTQVPHFLTEMGSNFSGLIGCTQPRRIAAISVATRVAEEMDVPLGEEVGYHVRFQTMKSAKTRVLYLTDGMLLREAFSDADLSRYSIVVVDEAHERTVDTDVALGLLKELGGRRPMFRLVVMSATMDVQKIRSFFPHAPLIQVTGRMYDVEVAYMPQPVRDYVGSAVARACEIHRREPAGDILCFLTGELEIERAVAATKAELAYCLLSSSDERSMRRTDALENGQPFSSTNQDDTDVPRPTVVEVLPLFGTLALQEQHKVFQRLPANTRKIVFATNIAETSVTIDGVVYVVDSGYQKQSLYNSQVRVDYLLPAVISKASAEQRKGRAGRTRPGKCYRLYTAEDFASFPEQTHPEILRTNNVSTVLLLLKLGVSNPCDFPFIDAPSEQGLGDAFYQLFYFGAVDEALQLTDFGKRMAEFPVNTCLSRMLLKAADHGCASDAIVLAAMLEAGNVFLHPPSRVAEANLAHTQLSHPDGDHVTLFLIFHGYLRSRSNGAKYCWDNFLRLQALQQAVQVYQQLRQLMAEQNIPIVSTYCEASNTVDSVALRRAVLEGFFTHVAYLGPKSQHYLTVRDGLPIYLHGQSSLSNKHAVPATWIMYDRLEVHGERGTFARLASPVKVEWLLEVSSFFEETAEIGNSDIAFALKQAAAARTAPSR